MAPPQRASLVLSCLPRVIVIRILSHLPYTSLLTCQRLSKRFNKLINLAPELRANLFHQPPVLPEDDFTSFIALHPIFSHLHFFAYHSAKAVRIGEGLDGKYLSRAKVREDFATSPALDELFLRVISGQGWEFDGEIVVRNKKGITVWNVITMISEFFNAETNITFGEHFGLQECKKRGLDDAALVFKHEFLNPDLPFPTIWFSSPDPLWNRQFIIDYSFSAFASQPLLPKPSFFMDSPEYSGDEEYLNKKMAHLAAMVRQGSGSFEEALEEHVINSSDRGSVDTIIHNPAKPTSASTASSGKGHQQEAIVLVEHDNFIPPPNHPIIVNKWATWAAQEADRKR